MGRTPRWPWHPLTDARRVPLLKESLADRCYKHICRAVYSEMHAQQWATYWSYVARTWPKPRTRTRSMRRYNRRRMQKFQLRPLIHKGKKP